MRSGRGRVARGAVSRWRDVGSKSRRRMNLPAPSFAPAPPSPRSTNPFRRVPQPPSRRDHPAEGERDSEEMKDGVCFAHLVRLGDVGSDSSFVNGAGTRLAILHMNSMSSIGTRGKGGPSFVPSLPHSPLSQKHHALSLTESRTSTESTSSPLSNVFPPLSQIEIRASALSVQTATPPLTTASTRSSRQKINFRCNEKSGQYRRGRSVTGRKLSRQALARPI